MDQPRNTTLFISKLWKLVNDPTIDDQVSWNESGTSFIIKHQMEFCCAILPQYYKHNNMSSFVRQLNMYGFHKVLTADNGTMNASKGRVEFYHPHFQADRPDQLQFIRRKVLQPQMRATTMPVTLSAATTRNELDGGGGKMQQLLGEIEQLKEAQKERDDELAMLRQENKTMWQELNTMKDKYSKQSNILQNLVHFMMTFVQKRMSDAKRRFQVSSGKDNKNTSGLNISDLEGLTIQELADIAPEDIDIVDETSPIINVNNNQSVVQQQQQEHSGNLISDLVTWDNNNKTNCSPTMPTSDLQNSDPALIQDILDTNSIPSSVGEEDFVNNYCEPSASSSSITDSAEKSNNNNYVVDTVTPPRNLYVLDGVFDSVPALDFLKDLPMYDFNVDEDTSVIMDDPMISGYKMNSSVSLNELFDESNHQEDQETDVPMMF